MQKKKPRAFGYWLKASFDETKVCLEEVYNIKKVTFNMIYLFENTSKQNFEEEMKKIMDSNFILQSRNFFEARICIHIYVVDELK